MEETVKKLLCRPINLLLQDEGFYKRPSIQIFWAYIIALLMLSHAISFVLSDVCLLIKSYLSFSNNQWFSGGIEICFFVFINFFAWWGFKNIERIGAFIQKRNLGRKSGK